ncbi:FAD-dependent oxidoreductase [Streptomyces sp. NPDC050504]|uniref:FAD-dependent oxidoreductase n=1 Tax=Streptomyces sp. NPDC050504 TaxID=3365618 RepID=UPI00378E54F2
MNRTAGAGARTAAVDVLVVGAGPAGLAAATALSATGVTVDVVDRARDAPPGVRGGVTAIGWAAPRTLDLVGPAGPERVAAGAVVLATGARERPRGARLVPGTRPAGVYTGGELIGAVRRGTPIGRRAVVVGGERISDTAVRTLRGAGVLVAAMVTDEDAPARRARTQPIARAVVTRLYGVDRLSGVGIRLRDGRTRTLSCDTVVFTGDWIPEHELARRAGAAIDPGTRGPVVDGGHRTTVPGVFAVGSLLNGSDPANSAARQGRSLAGPVLDYLADGAWPPDGPGASASIGSSSAADQLKLGALRVSPVNGS